MTLIGNAYRRIYSKVSSSPTNFSWVIENRLAGSGLPLRVSQFRWLLDHRIDSIVTVREVPLPNDWLRNPNAGGEIANSKSLSTINYLHLPVEDYRAPTIEQLKSAISFIENEIKFNRSAVLVHCAAGKGRTGTILAAYLLKNDGLSVESTIKRLRRLRPGSIQTPAQEQILYQYADWVKKV